MQGDDASWEPSINGDGRFVVFYSDAANLVPGDTNAAEDIFVHDRQAGTTERVSVSSNGTQGNGYSYSPSISEDGRFVAYYSDATNLVPGDTNVFEDIFVHDRQTGATERVSVSSGGGQGNLNSLNPAVNSDGRFVAFESGANNLVVADTNNGRDVFVHDRQTGATERVSVSSGGVQGNQSSLAPSISSDGRFVAFFSSADDLVVGDTTVNFDVFVHDRQTRTTDRVSVSSSGTQGNLNSFSPSVSGDGRFVAFASDSDNLVAGDTNVNFDIFVHDRQTGTTERVSVSSSGTQGNNQSFDPLHQWGRPIRGFRVRCRQPGRG